MTRAAERLPLARNSESSRDLRPRPPAANKSAGRLQTQNFHVGKSQDGRERSARGEPAGNAWRPALEGRPGSLRRAPTGPRGRAPGRGAVRSATTARSPGRLRAPRTSPAARAPRPGSLPTALGPWLRGVAGEGTVAGGGGRGGGEDTLQTCCTGATAVGAVRRGRGPSGRGGGGRCCCRGRGAGGHWEPRAVLEALQEGRLSADGGPREACCLTGQGEPRGVGGGAEGRRRQGSEFGAGRGLREDREFRGGNGWGGKGKRVEAPQSPAFLGRPICGAFPGLSSPLFQTLPAPRTHPSAPPSPTSSPDRKVKSCHK